MKLPVRLHAGNNGVYDAVQFDRGEWRIRYRPHCVATVATLEDLVAITEFSESVYDSAHEAALAFERGPVTYLGSLVVA
jgi:hypothetical protein